MVAAAAVVVAMVVAVVVATVGSTVAVGTAAGGGEAEADAGLRRARLAETMAAAGWVERAGRVVATVAVEVAAMVGRGLRARVEVATAVVVVATGAVGTASAE